MERIIVEMTWEVPNKCTPAQRKLLRNMVDTFMNNVAEKFAWDEEMFSIENDLEKEVK
jgi:hypothetical protein